MVRLVMRDSRVVTSEEYKDASNCCVNLVYINRLDGGKMYELIIALYISYIIVYSPSIYIAHTS